MKTIGEMVKGRELYSVGPDATVLDATRLMSDKGVGAVLVVEEGRLQGIFSERDLVTRVIAPNLNPAEVKVRDVMTRNLIVAGPDDTYQDCLNKMKQARIRHLPIVAENRVIGMLSVRDLINYELESKDFEIQQLNHFIHYVPPKVTA